MLEELNYETAQPLVGTSFWAMPRENVRLELRLVRVGKVMESQAARLKRTAFSMFFFGPKELKLEQQIYTITHDAFAEPLEIFLVPVEQHAEGYLYEAVFT